MKIKVVLYCNLCKFIKKCTRQQTTGIKNAVKIINRHIKMKYLALKINKLKIISKYLKLINIISSYITIDHHKKRSNQ